MSNQIQSSTKKKLKKIQLVFVLMYLPTSLSVNVSTMFISTMYNNGMEIHKDSLYDTIWTLESTTFWS